MESDKQFFLKNSLLISTEDVNEGADAGKIKLFQDHRLLVRYRFWGRMQRDIFPH